MDAVARTQALEERAPELDLAELELELDRLEASGARLFDAPTCECIRALIQRAEELGGETRRLLAERAESHLERLRARFSRAREEARERLAACESERGVQPALRDLLEMGDLLRVRRALRRLAQTPLYQAADQRRAHKRGAEYEESLAELVAAFALARAVEVVPEHAGPYNPLRIASDLLARMRAVSPLYLTIQLNRLEELASLLALPELPKRPSAPTAKKRRSLKS